MIVFWIVSLGFPLEENEAGVSEIQIGKTCEEGKSPKTLILNSLFSKRNSFSTKFRTEKYLSALFGSPCAICTTSNKQKRTTNTNFFIDQNNNIAYKTATNVSGN